MDSDYSNYIFRQFRVSVHHLIHLKHSLSYNLEIHQQNIDILRLLIVMESPNSSMHNLPWLWQCRCHSAGDGLAV